jgi:hypothetical protein
LELDAPAPETPNATLPFVGLEKYQKKIAGIKKRKKGVYISVWNGVIDEPFPAEYRSSQVISQEPKHIFRSVVFLPFS